MEGLWFIALFSAICLEGLGRKYLPQIPSVAFYFLKDLVLLYGYFRYRPPASVVRTIRYLYRGFGIVVVAGMAWTFLELFNPAQESIVLGLIGLRAYWLWWLAPGVIAGVLQNSKLKRRSIYALALMAIGIAILAAFQFSSPASSSLNLYTVKDGEEIHASDMAVVYSTGRARVAGTFAFLSGFVAFTLTIPTLLLSLGLEVKEVRLRRVALVAALAVAATLPMSGSRGSVLIGAGVLVLTMWTGGLFFTPIGRRIVIAGTAAAILSVIAFPDALLGVESRFGDTEETDSRFMEIATYLPPVALVVDEYPMAGIGTGMQQNARSSFNLVSEWQQEGELERYLTELGPVGFLLIWTAKLGLVFALMRAYAILKRAGKRGAAGAALSYAVLTMIGDLAFDHNWQALYFTGCGFILAEVVPLLRASVPVPAATSVAQIASPERTVAALEQIPS
ncbi:MAG TPA: hypothetical protein VFG23_13515 [Polyangia bacterium]|nr:hypothetical protein [Polyangia bacterium]